ncbi:endocuticle structural glycoprotein SgAbd-2 [Periplaneta americana]|uniref:endocuticle structural glycoprotein SgAbd-2 n=1 Tax=Periplaneta americana TaxID=6978 RepID=UPI0037E994A1
MYRLVVLVALAALSTAQYHQNAPQTAAILSEQRYLAGDGTFGAAYSQEDGVEFKEESDVNGNRQGSYSYVDPSGQRRTVTYTAGKDGFRASGAHLPVAPAPAAPQPQYQPQPQYNPPPQQQYQPQPQYNPPPQPQYQPQQQYNPPPQQQYYQPPQNSISQYNPTTPPPHRFYPPGKLNLNRTPDGFTYTFNKS